MWKEVPSPRPVTIDSTRLFTYVEKKTNKSKKTDGLNIFDVGREGRLAAGSHQLSSACVSGAGVWYSICPRPLLPVCSPLLYLSQLFLSLQPASPQTGGQATPLRSPRHERRVTEPDNTANCSIFLKKSSIPLCLEIWLVLSHGPPPPGGSRTYAERERESPVKGSESGRPAAQRTFGHSAEHPARPTSFLV